MKKYLQLLLALVMAYATQAQDPAYPPAPVAAVNITAAEYFIDQDPGVGNGTGVAAGAAVDVSNVAPTVHLNGLSNGVHRLYLRTRNASGYWSITAVKDFLYDLDIVYGAAPLVAQQIARAEYFIDTDPGFGVGTAIAITPGLDLSNVPVSVNVAGLGNGTHRLYIRSKSNEGRWSLAAEKDFIVDFNYNYPAAPVAALQIVAAEYFFDTDPGPGSGTAISFTPGMDVANITRTVNTTGLGIGIHRMYMRTKSQEGRWSLTAEKDLSVNLDLGYPAAPAAAQNILRAEYFFDTDPGAGNAAAITIMPGTTLSDVSFAANVASLSGGRHRLFVRTKSQEGRWSLASSDTVYVGVRPPGWAISPAGGHDFGTVLAGSPVIFNFTVNNTGSQAVALRNAFSTDPAFVVSFSAGTSIPAGGSVNLPVTFTPTAVAGYSSRIGIISDADGPDTVTTVVTGNGYLAGTPPSLNYVTAQPFSGVRGVSSDAGLPGLYTYKILYQSATGRAPQAGYPKVGIDRNGDGDFDDADESMYTMTKEGSGTDYTAGVVYTYTVNFTNYSNTLGYQFFAVDDQGNAAVAGNTAYKGGPVVTYELPDLKLFANDISFSKSNPLPNEAFTMTANVTNSSAFNVTNVPVKFYKDTILLGSAIIPFVNAFSSATISQVFSFPGDGFYPIKVWVDSSRTLSESNYLNNYAIRPVIVGTVVLPGGIHVTTGAVLQTCPQAMLISGHAEYFGTASPTAVAGGEVTITLGSQVITTTTDANGDYSYLLNNPACGGVLAWSVRVTDFTFTSPAAAGSLSVPCPAANACVVTPQPGIVMASLFTTDPCSQVKGSRGNIELTATYRARDLNNMWCLWDVILQDTVSIYQNGVLIATYGSADGTTSPGSTKTFSLNVSLDETGPNVFVARQHYIYNEFYQNQDNFYHGIFRPYGGSSSITLLAEDTRADLTITDFAQSGYTSFSFADVNLKCGDAGPHTVQIWDSIPGGIRTLIRTYNVSGLSGKTQRGLSFSDPTLVFGSHFIRIVTDTGGSVAESDETNNVFMTELVVPKPDLSIESIKPAYTSLVSGMRVGFMAVVKNTGSGTGAFKVAFRANGVLIGNPVAVAGVGEKGSITVVSDQYVVTTQDVDCPVIIMVTADDANQVIETSKTNNSGELLFASDLAPYMVSGEEGSASNPVVVRVNANTVFKPLVRNIGARDVSGVTVRFSVGGIRVGGDQIALVRAGEDFASAARFSHVFTVAGDYVVQMSADTAGLICEADETNNTGNFYIRVVESNPDLEVLSQYISPSSLNPNPGQAISIVGTVKNVGLKASQPNVMRFMVDDVQLGADVPLNGLQPGRDTTVAATALYSSVLTGVKVMTIVVDPGAVLVEEREDNNEATRTMIVGDAPDFALAHTGAIGFSPSGFRRGDSVVISYAVRNAGSQDGTAWVRFRILDASGALTALDSVPFYLGAGGSGVVNRTMLFDVNSGTVIAEIVGASPMEFDLLNNSDRLDFSTVAKLKANTTVSGDLDMKDGLPDELPGWIGGKLVLGDFDLVVEGSIQHFDTAHFVITNGTGKLRLVNAAAVNVYPVGPSLGSPNFVRINNAGVPDHFSVRVLPFVLRNGVGGDTVRTANVNRTWLLEEDGPGGSNASVEFFWSHADELPGFDGGVSRVAHYYGSWAFGDLGSAVVDTNGQFSRIQAGYNSFSPFVVTTGSGVSLPLDLLEFGVSRQGSDVVLRWKTTNEVNTSRYIVEHGADGVAFREIGTVAALNAAGIHDYEWLHERVGEGLHYYRLKMVDLDGSARYSPIRSILFDGGGAVQVYPNPAEQFIIVKGLVSGGTLDVLTMDGVLVRRLVASGSGMTVDLSRMAAGVYFVRWTYEGKVQSQRIIKR